MHAGSAGGADLGPLVRPRRELGHGGHDVDTQYTAQLDSETYDRPAEQPPGADSIEQPRSAGSIEFAPEP